MIKRISDNKILLAVLFLVLLAFFIGTCIGTGTYVSAATAPYVTSSGIHANGTAILITDGVGYNSSGNLLSRIYFDYNGSGDLSDPESYNYCFTDSAATTEIEFTSTQINGTSVTVSTASSYDLSSFSIYGGSYNSRGDANTVGNTSVSIAGGNVLYVYGGSLGGEITGITNVYITGGTIGSTKASGEVYGGSEDGIVNGYTNVTISGTARIMGNVYGGGNNATATVYGTTNVNVLESAEIYGSVFGGGNTASIYGETFARLSGGFVGTASSDSAVYGGGNVGAIFGGTNVFAYGDAKVYGSLFGGGNLIASTINGSGDGEYLGAYTNVIVTDNAEITGFVMGGGNASSLIDYIDPITYVSYPAKTTVTFAGGTATSVYGGGMSGSVSETHVNVSGGTVASVFGGGYEGMVTTTDVVISGSAVVTSAVYGGGDGIINGGDVSLSTSVTISGGKVATVYGGGYKGDVIGTGSYNPGTTTVTVTGGTVTGNIFGGGYLQEATIGTSTSFPGVTNVIISGGNVTNVYGGGQNDSVYGNTNVTISGGVSNNIYGGGLQGYVEDVTITLKGGNINSVNAKHYINGEKEVAVSLSSNLEFSGVLGTRNSDGSSDGISSFSSGGYNLISSGNVTDGSVLAYFESESLLSSAVNYFKFSDSNITYKISQSYADGIYSIMATSTEDSAHFPIWIVLGFMICALVIFAYFLFRHRK